MGDRISIQKKRARYTAVSLPKEMLEQIDEIVKEYPGFRSRAEYVKEAIKEKLNEDKRSAWWGPKVTQTKTYQEFKKKELLRRARGEKLEDLLNSFKEEIISAINKKVITESQKKKKWIFYLIYLHIESISSWYSSSVKKGFLLDIIKLF